jgi:hypothetical protein
VSTCHEKCKISATEEKRRNRQEKRREKIKKKRIKNVHETIKLGGNLSPRQLPKGRSGWYLRTLSPITLPPHRPFYTTISPSPNIVEKTRRQEWYPLP